MKDLLGKVIINKKIAEGIFKMVLACENLPKIKCGQFVQIKLPDTAFLLRRPFCISDYDYENGTIEVVYQIKGEGTKALVEVKKGESLMCLLPLGNGFTLEEKHKKVVLLGGGMGSVVLPSIIREYKDKEYYTYLGFANKSLVVCDELLEKSKGGIVMTDDGSNGNKGYATDKLLREIGSIKPDIIISCGPEPMYKAMQKTFANLDCEVKISLEGRMGCGFGACLVCACKIKKAGEVKTLRVCKDGPVFDLLEVEL